MIRSKILIVSAIVRWKVLAGIAIAALLVFGGCGGGGKGEEWNGSGELQALLDARWAEFSAARPGIKGSLGLLIRSPQGGFFSAAGDAFQGGADGHIRGASTTKTFTAAAIMLLHQEGRLNIDARVTELIPGQSEPYLPNTPDYAIPHKEEITIRALLEHRAGVFDLTNSPIPSDLPAPYAGKMYFDYIMEDLGESNHTFTFDELASVVSRNRLFHSPPGPFFYSNTGYSLLGKIIERVSGIRYHAFMEQRFVSPLGLDGTTFPFEGNDLNLPEPVVPGYAYYQGELYPIGAENFSGSVGEGNIRTTPNDLSRWIRALLEGEAGVNEETLALMQSIRPTGESHQLYGLGLSYTEGLGYGHNGGHQGYITVMRHNPVNDVTVVVFMSVTDFGDLNAQALFLYEVASAGIAAVGD